MRILLLAMPDSAEFVAQVSRMPSLGLVSLAGSLAGHRVRVLDLVLAPGSARAALGRALEEFRPHLVGLSAMSFQYASARSLAGAVKDWNPGVLTCLGGYHATLDHLRVAAEEPGPFDFLVRGEGEETLRELADRLEGPAPDLGAVAGLSFRTGSGWDHNPDRPLLDLSLLPLPDRSCRILEGFRFLGLRVDVAEFSRGCPHRCRFCSIRGMYGPVFRRFPVERIIRDLKQIRDRGGEYVFLADDNIVADPDHLSGCCRAIVEAGLDRMLYSVQLGSAGLAANPHLAREMARANIRIAFVGFESMLPGNLKGMDKPTSPRVNQRAARILRENGIAIVAGFISGFPEDDKARIRYNNRMIRKLKPDMLYSQFLPPYPGTEVRSELLREGLVENPGDLSRYDGFTCNVRTRRLSRGQLSRLMMLESFKFVFNPAHLWRNFFLRRMPGPLLASQLRSLLVSLRSQIPSGAGGATPEP